jgi:hypothetical protein
VLLPAANERDIDDIPKNVRRKLEFVLIENADDALKHILVHPVKPGKANGQVKKQAAKRRSASGGQVGVGAGASADIDA